MAYNDCKDAGSVGVRGCVWRRLQVCCGLWGGPCRYLGGITDTTGGRERVDVRNRSVAGSCTNGDAPHTKGINVNFD